jgi:hypothetical protein
MWLSSVAVSLTLLVPQQVDPLPDVTAVLAPLTFTAQEKQAVDLSLEILRGCCLPDGAIVVSNLGTAPTTPVWIVTYFANHNACALLATGKADDRELVRKWLEWQVTHQEPGGWWNDWEGTRAAYANTGRVDAFDSNVAFYLLVLRKYQKAGGIVSPGMRTAAEKALACLETCINPDTGLPWAKPTYKASFLMDATEVYAGYASGAAFFASVRDSGRSRLCAARRNRLRSMIPKYWNAEERLYSWAEQPGTPVNGQYVGVYSGGLDDLYPHGLANLFGCSFVGFRSASFRQVTDKFTPETIPYGTGTERFAMAAARAGGSLRKTWRDRATADALGFKPDNVYSFRPALYVLLAYRGADWMPSLASFAAP